MPIIKARDEKTKKMARLRGSITEEQHEVLEAYAAFINEPADWVIGQLIETQLAKDKEFLAATGAGSGRKKKVTHIGDGKEAKTA